MAEETVEILLASRNGAAYIREQIDSILSQDGARWHLTLSDDGSTDGTAAILDEYAARYPDRIARHVSGRRFGSARDHFFYLMARCDAPYMMFCDQDDVWYPGKVRKTLEALRAIEAERGADAPALAFCDQRPTDEHLRPLADSLMRYQRQYTEGFDYRALLMQNVVTGGAAGINRALARLAGRCLDTSRVIMHDWWVAAVAARFGKIAYIDEVLGDYRQHGDNAVGAKDVASAKYVLGELAGASSVRRSILQKKAQARCFQQTYGELLGAEDGRFLGAYARPRSGLMFYLKHRKLIHGFWRLTGLMVLG